MTAPEWLHSRPRGKDGPGEPRRPGVWSQRPCPAHRLPTAAEQIVPNLKWQARIIPQVPWVRNLAQVLAGLQRLRPCGGGAPFPVAVVGFGPLLAAGRGQGSSLGAEQDGSHLVLGETSSLPRLSIGGTSACQATLEDAGRRPQGLARGPWLTFRPKNIKRGDAPLTFGATRAPAAVQRRRDALPSSRSCGPGRAHPVPRCPGSCAAPGGAGPQRQRLASPSDSRHGPPQKLKTAMPLVRTDPENRGERSQAHGSQWWARPQGPPRPWNGVQPQKGGDPDTTRRDLRALGSVKEAGRRPSAG